MGPIETPETPHAPPTNVAQLKLYFQPRGGCNEDDAGSNCSLLTYGWLKDNCLQGDTILFGLGTHPVRRGPDGPVQTGPDITDLLDSKSPQKLRAIFLSHAHTDEFEGVVRYLEHGYRLPPLYGDALTINIVQEKLRGRIHKGSWPEMHIMQPGEVVQVGAFSLEAVQMGHTLSGSGLVAKAGGAGVFFTGDFKLDQTMLTPKTDLARLEQMGRDKEIDVLLLDSTRADKLEELTPEAEIRENIRAIAAKHPTKRINVVLETGNAEALARAGWLAAEECRVYIHHGRTIEQRLCAMNKSSMDLPTLTGHENLIVASAGTQLAGKLGPSYVLNVMAGVNGEASSVFSRVCRGEYEHFKAGPEDVFIFSAQIRPWSALRIGENLRALRDQGVEHIYLNGPENPKTDESGHEPAPGLKRLQQLVQPRSAVVGIVGGENKREACRELFNDLGEQTAGLRIDNGTILAITPTEAHLAGHQPAGLVTIPVRPKLHTAHDLKVA